MNKHLLLLDINETLDDSNDILMRSYMYRGEADTSEYNEVVHQRRGTQEFAELLKTYKEQIDIVFWTGVSVIGQKYVAETYLDLDDYYLFSSNAGCQNISDYNGEDYAGIARPKSKHINSLLDYFDREVESIIWFEDSLDRDDEDFCNNRSDVYHIGIKGNQSLTEVIPSIEASLLL